MTDKSAEIGRARRHEQCFRSIAGVSLIGALAADASSLLVKGKNEDTLRKAGLAGLIIAAGSSVMAILKRRESRRLQGELLEAERVQQRRTEAEMQPGLSESTRLER